MPRRDPAKAIAVLDAMLKFFDGGRRWTRGDMEDKEGNRCLVGALHKACRTVRCSPIGAASLLCNQLSPYQRLRFGPNLALSFCADGLLMHFNDTRMDYGEVRWLIERARKVAQAEVDHERSLQSRSIRQPRVEGRVSGDPRHPMHDATRSDASERSHPGDPVHAA